MENLPAQIRETIQGANRIILTTHTNPDGDALGSMTALYGILRGFFGKEVVMVATGNVPASLNFLPYFFKVKDGFDPEPDDIGIILDCGGWSRTGLFELDTLTIDWPRSVVVIDHHAVQGLTPGIHYVDSQSSSTSELIAKLMVAWGMEIDKDIATALLTGLVFDTGSFRHINTTAETLNLAGELTAKGADLQQIMKPMFLNKSVGQLKLWGRILSSMKYDPTRQITTAYVTQNDLSELAVSEEALSGVANLMNTIPSLKFSMLLTEQSDNTVRGSLRTEHADVDVADLAKLLGGGGHAKAAGFQLLKSDQSDPSTRT